MTKNYQKVFTKVAWPKSFLLLPKCSWGHVRVNFTSQKKHSKITPEKAPFLKKLPQVTFLLPFLRTVCLKITFWSSKDYNVKIASCSLLDLSQF